MNTINLDRPSKTSDPVARPDVLKGVLLAVFVTIGLYFIPYLSFLTYPLRILVTFAHEGGHALAAVLTGGHVGTLQVNPDGSGVTMSGGGIGFIISSAGYLGATLFGALLLAAQHRGVPGRKLLTIVGAYVLALTLFFVRLFPNPAMFLFSLFWGLALAAGLLFAGFKMPEKSAGWLASFIGVQCVLNAFFDLNTLFALSVSTGTHTDAMNMQNATLIPAVVWAVLWILSAIAILYGVLIAPAIKAAKRQPALNR